MNWFRRMMIGRYGIDQLGIGLIAASFLCVLLRSITHWNLFYWFGILLLALCYIRFFSRNLIKRADENRRFLSWWNPVADKLKNQKSNFEELQNYHHFKCPSCGQKIRVPRGRGKISITCPGCRNQFVKKS